MKNPVSNTHPLVTIVTPSFNQGSFIAETIESVLQQDFSPIEYWVIDGGSTDNTLQILGRYADRIKWVSERDQGQADAVNKGFRLAAGQILGWLNSDDTYLPGAVRKVVDYFDHHPEVAMVYGEAYNTDAQGNIIERFPTEPYDHRRLAETCFISQPAVFIRRSVLDEVGLLDGTLQYTLDYEYWMRVGKRFRIAHVPELLATSRVHAATKTVAKRKEAHQELISTVQRHYSFVPLRTIYVYTYVSLIERLMPNIQGVYPNGWSTSHVTILLRGNCRHASLLRLKGYVRTKRASLNLRLTTGGQTLVKQVSSSGRLLLSHSLCADGAIHIDTEETGSDVSYIDQCAILPEERPLSYRLTRGAQFMIQRVSILDDSGRETILFSRGLMFLKFVVTFPFMIIWNTVLINRRLSFREQCVTLIKLLRCILPRSQAPQGRARI